MKTALHVFLLFSGFFSGGHIFADEPDIWASVSAAHIPNRSPAGNKNFGVVIVVTILNPSNEPMFFDVYDSFAIRVLDAKQRVINDNLRADAPVVPTMQDVVRLRPGWTFSRAYDLHLRNAELTIEDGTGTIHRFALPGVGEYTVELGFENDAGNPFLVEFEKRNCEDLIKQFYRRPRKLGAFKIQVEELNKEQPRR